MTLLLEQSIVIVCGSSGSMNQILAELDGCDLDGVVVCVEGAAKKLWQHSRGDVSILACDLPKAISDAQTLITGTGWGDLEHIARKVGLQQGVYSIALLDHWTSYLERFVRDGELILPDEIWVVDEYACAMARSIFPNCTVTLRPDYYALQQMRGIAPLPDWPEGDLLYLLEPMGSNWERDDLGENQALMFFFEQLPKLCLPASTVIRLRPHPSESPGKYEKFLSKKWSHQVRLDTQGLASSLSDARWVVGCQTYAMTLALSAGRTVYCSLPPWAPACQLPHNGILFIKDFSAF